MSLFVQHMQKRVLFLDGAMGTSIHELEDLELERDYLGRENCTEVLLLTRPEVIQQIHEDFLAAGSDAVETDSFNAQLHTMEDQDLVDRVHELNVLAAQTARKACDNFATPERPRFVVGSMGPGTQLITLGNIDWDTMLASYAAQVRGLLDGGADVLLIETAQDILQVKCAITAILDVLAERGLTPDTDGTGDVPIMVQVTIEQFGTTLVGTDIAGVVAALRDYPILSLGMNCATGPTEMAEHVQAKRSSLCRASRSPKRSPISSSSTGSTSWAAAAAPPRATSPPWSRMWASTPRPAPPKKPNTSRRSPR